MAAVGLLESMMTAQIVDDMTDTPSDKRRECKGQCIANFVTGFLGGMGGCAMIGQSVINVKSGGSTRLSTFVAGAFLHFLRSEEHTSELQSLLRNSYAVFSLLKKQ